MSGFFTFLWLVANIVMIVFIIKAIKSKDAAEKKKNRKIWLISLGAAFLCMVIAATTMPTTDDNETEEEAIVEEITAESTEDAAVTENTEVDEIEALKAELKEKYDISEPSKFAKGDTTGKWRINTVANSTPPNDYAVDYAKAYMSEGDVYYIVNLSLKTTNQFRLNNNILEVYTTEYVDKEEHDASDTSMFSAAEIAEDRISSITDNILELDDKYYNTWEKVTVDFGNIGAITLDKTDVVNNGYGKYFDYPYGVFTE